MSKIHKKDTIVFVTFTTPPIPACYEKNLYQHLFMNVCAVRGEVEEDIRVMCDNKGDTKFIAEIRYQFGEDFFEDMADEIGELISEQLDIWLAKNCIEEYQFV
ncbi:hypothetical protein [Limnohabitans sp. Hippo4]|uniref:hypothetical protein n=1 Tax=Limnohabitans sp. Hippo4 TaxID=1826167 RepID=UPI000D3C026A|nr:hypothetical protein [Limnohabitans sp. Hippo4]PUE35536.1 hypothetical protein B9Z46_10850 [Limnohabitans sp. Hippo4]